MWWWGGGGREDEVIRCKTLGGWGVEGGVFLNVHEQYRDVVYLYSIREECFNKAVWHKPQAPAALSEKKIKILIPPF